MNKYSAYLSEQDKIDILKALETQKNPDKGLMTLIKYSKSILVRGER